MSEELIGQIFIGAMLFLMYTPVFMHIHSLWYWKRSNDATPYLYRDIIDIYNSGESEFEMFKPEMGNTIYLRLTHSQGRIEVQTIFGSVTNVNLGFVYDDIDQFKLGRKLYYHFLPKLRSGF